MPRRVDLSSMALFVLVLLGVAAVALTAGDYGVSWDEGVQARYGELVLDYFRSGGADLSANELSNLRYYGPGVELLAAAIYRPSPERWYVVRHVLSALLALATLPAIYLVGRRLGSGWIGVFAAIALVMTPRFYGHAFINSKDIPFACLFAWTVVATLYWLGAGKRRWLAAAGLALAFGLLLAIRPAGIVLVPVVMAPAIIMRLIGDKPMRDWRIAVQLICAVAAAWIIMVIPWPYAHQNPIVNPVRAIYEAVRFDVSYPVLFAGEVTESKDLPLTYLPQYLLITTPLVILALAAVGLVLGFRKQMGEPGRRDAMVLVVSWLLLPVLMYFVQRPNVYDGLRHFLFLLPAVAILAGLGLYEIASMMSGRGLRIGVSVAGVLLLLIPIGWLVRSHPYQMTYFNVLVGGVEGAAGMYETDYWITSYREAIEWVAAQCPESEGEVGVLVAGPKNALPTVVTFKPPHVRVAMTFDLPPGNQLHPQFKYYIATTRYGLSERYGGTPVVHSIGRDGAVFTVIRGRE